MASEASIKVEHLQSVLKFLGESERVALERTDLTRCLLELMSEFCIPQHLIDGALVSLLRLRVDFRGLRDVLLQRLRIIMLDGLRIILLRLSSDLLEAGVLHSCWDLLPNHLLSRLEELVQHLL